MRDDIARVSPRPKNTQGERLRLLAAIAAGFLGTLGIALILSSQGAREPGARTAVKSGIISFVTLNEIPAWPNYALLLLSMGIVGAVALAWPAPSARHSIARAYPVRISHMVTVAAAAIASLVVLLTPFSWDATDPFHEGEYVAFGNAAMMHVAPSSVPVFVHGFGMNALPGILAKAMADQDAGIAAARNVRWMFLSLTWAGIWAILLAFAVGRQDRASPGLAFLAMALGLIMLGGQPFGTQFFFVTSRGLIRVWQVAAIVWALKEGPRNRLGIMLFLAGFLAPVGLLYNYSEAVSFALDFACALAILAFRSPPMFRTAVFSFAGGLAVGLAGLVAARGEALIGAAIRDIGYWAQHAHEISGLPLQGTSRMLLFAEVVIFAGSGIVWLVQQWRREGSLREVVTRYGQQAFLVFVAFNALRSQLQRPDDIHLMFAGLYGSLVLLIVLSYWWGRTLAWRPTATASGMALAVLVVLLPINRNGLFRSHVLPGTLPSTMSLHLPPDSALVGSGYLEAAQAIGGQIPVESCFFTLTSEGLWYHLLDRRSCSRWHHIIYARTEGARRELVADLARERPPIILFRNEFWSNELDGIPVAVSHPDVLEFVRSNYVPHVSIRGNEFWRLRRQ